METKLEPATLVTLLAVTAKSDTTAPPCWRTDVLLGAIEKLVVHTLNQPRLFAEICDRSLKDVTDPATKAIIKLGIINGLRRSDDADVYAVQELFRTRLVEIDELEDGPRKDRCLSFWRYQAKVFMARNGFYADAAKAEAAASATGKAEEQVVSAYLSRVYEMWTALVYGTPEHISECLMRLKQALLGLESAVAGTNLEVQWGKGNGPIHVLQAMLFSSSFDESWPHLIDIVRENADKLGEAFAPWVQALVAADKFRNGWLDEAAMLAKSISDSNVSADSTAAARLIQARYLAAISATNEAKEMYRLIQPAPNAHMIATVAARELAALGG